VAKVTFPIVFRREAKQEFDEAYDWYESQQAGLGERFAAQVQIALNRIATMPQIHATIHEDVRKAVVRRFPYCVYYRQEESLVRVLAVFHTSRDPANLQERA
jgi:plasmid stabilization system protein ParE